MMERQKKSKILIADESISVQKLVHLTFADSDLDVVVALDGYDILQKVKSLKPEILLVDSQLSGTDGVSIVESIRRDHGSANLKIILFFSGADKDLLARLKAVKPDGLLRKPFDSRDLKEVVNYVLDEESTVIKTGTIKTSTTQTIVLEDEDKDKEGSPVVQAMPPVTVETAPPIEVSAHAPILTEAQMIQIYQAEIKIWMSEHLPPIAEKLIKEEIERIAAR